MMENASVDQKTDGTAAADGKRSDGMWAFFILTYAMMLLTWGVLAVFQMRVVNTADTDTETSALALTLLFIGGFTPSIAGIFMAYRQQGRVGLQDLWKRFIQINLGARWYLVIVAIPVLTQLGTSLIYNMWGGAFVRPEFLEQPASLIPLAIAIFIGGPLSEEFGWRGFAQNRVQARWGGLKGSLFLGLAWAFWHLPLFFIPGSGQQAVGSPALMFPVYAIYVMGMTIWLTWVYNNTNRSIWGVVFFHFTLNLGANIQLLFSEITPRFLYISNAGMTVLLALILVVITKGKLQTGAKDVQSEIQSRNMVS